MNERIDVCPKCGYQSTLFALNEGNLRTLLKLLPSNRMNVLRAKLTVALREAVNR